MADVDERASPLEGRWRWLGAPGFLASVLVLVVNDHVLKSEVPGWVTGKLSDVAGMAVVGTLLAVVLGLRRGLIVAGLGFIALKTVPGVAEVLRPALGGVTIRDATDLVALPVLLVLWLMLRRRDPGRESRSERPAGMPGRPASTGLARALTASLPLVAAVFAVTTATATSCGPSPAVISVEVQGDSLVAQVSEGWGNPELAQSDDGGFTWHRISLAPGSSSTTVDLYEDPGQTGPIEACGADGSCWRIRDRRSIDHRSPSGDWSEEARLNDDDFQAISTNCAGAQVGVLSSLALAGSTATPNVVASLGAEGVLTRHDDGAWTRERVLSAPPEEGTSTDRAGTLATILFGPLLALALLLGRRWFPSWRTGLLVAGLGWLATISAVGALGFIAGSDTDPDVVGGRAGLAGAAVVTVAAFVVARRPRKPPRLPPPPTTPPPPSTTGVTGDLA